ncbi:hypothetical protein KAH55_06600, partial [bacterium]|nr:hypothetical protein [bacterium]
MKLLQLRLENINSIRQPVVLDFENGPLSEASLFGITGPTGAGKTTLLDALSVALYHKTPRLDGRDSKNPENLLSQGAQEGIAEVEFAANGQRYLAEWKVKRGARSQKVSSSVKLLNMNTNQVLNEKKNQNPVPEILGLDFDAFRRAVLLAQGEFAAFLKANVEEKRALLESTTGMGLYDKLREILNQQVNAVRSDFAAVTAALTALPTTDPEQIHTFETRLVESEKELEKQIQDGDTLSVELDHEKQRQRNWQKLSDLDGQLLQFQEQEQEYGDLQNEIKLADQARQIEPEHQAFLDYQQQAADITTEVSVADSDFQENNAIEAEKRKQLEKSETELKSSTAAARTQQKQLDAASRQEVELHGVAQQRDRLVEEESTLQAGVKTGAGEIKECQIKREKRVADIEQVNVFFADNPLPDNRNQVMVALNGFLSDWKNKTAQLQKITDQGKQQKAHHKDLKAQQLDISIKLKNTRQQLTTETGHLDALIKVRADLPELAAITAELPQYRKLEPVARDFEKNENANADKKNLTGEIENALVDLHQNLVKTKTLHDQHASAEKVSQERLARLEAEKKAAGLEQLVAEIRREHLSDGAPCPVCGSSEHPWAEKNDMELLAGIDAIHEKIALTETELAVIQKATQSDKTTLTRLETEITGKDHALVAVENDIELTVKVQRQLKSEWEKVLANQPINLSWLTDKIKKLETAEQEIHSLERQVNVIEKKQSEIKQQVVMLNKDSEIFTAEIQKTDAELVKLRDEYQQENAVCQEIANQIKEQLPQNCYALKIENSVREFEKLLNTAETKEKNRKEWQSQVDALQVEIKEKQRNYDADQQRLDTLILRREKMDKQIQLLEQEVFAKTNGQSVADARKKLEQELQLVEENLATARKTHQQAETKRTQALTALNEKKQRLVKVNQTMKT